MKFNTQTQSGGYKLKLTLQLKLTIAGQCNQREHRFLLSWHYSIGW